MGDMMTRDEKSLLVGLLGGRNPVQLGDGKKALSRLIAAGLVSVWRIRGWRSGHNRFELTQKGRMKAARLAYRFASPRNHVRPPDYWSPRPSKIAARTDRYGCVVYGVAHAKEEEPRRRSWRSGD